MHRLQRGLGQLADHYETLSKAQLISLLRKKDAEKKLGLVWERDEIEADAAIDANFVACAVDPALSDGTGPWRNLVIEGDNFDALRWLRMAYAKRVKCIYIDPPYNTGEKDWVYNDHYIDKNDRYRHSTWLEFLYRRLTLARDLDLPPSEWPNFYFRIGHEGGMEWRGNTSRKRSSASCVKLRSCWRRVGRWRMRVVGSASPSRATTAGARNMVA
jgi:hypothetical protein